MSSSAECLVHTLWGGRTLAYDYASKSTGTEEGGLMVQQLCRPVFISARQLNESLCLKTESKHRCHAYALNHVSAHIDAKQVEEVTHMSGLPIA